MEFFRLSFTLHILALFLRGTKKVTIVLISNTELDHLPGDVIQVGGLGNRAYLVQRVTLRIRNNFCLVSMVCNCLSGPLLVLLWWVVVGVLFDI